MLVCNEGHVIITRSVLGGACPSQRRWVVDAPIAQCFITLTNSRVFIENAMHIIAFVIVSWSKHSQSRCITTFFVILFFYFLTNLLFEQDSNDGQIHACSFESCDNVKALEGNIVCLSSPLRQLVRKAEQFCLLFQRASCMPVSLCRTWTTGQELGKIDLQVGVTMRIN